MDLAALERALIQGRRNAFFRLAVLFILTFLFVFIAFAPGKYFTASFIGASIAEMITKVYVTGLDQNMTCNSSIMPGWNLVAIPCETSNSSANSMFSSITGNYRSVHTYDPTDANDHWKAQVQGVPSWVLNDLMTVDPQKGYWIFAYSGDTLINIGTIEVPSSNDLVQGWNLAGFIFNESMSTADALSTIAEQVTIVYAYNATTMAFDEYDPGNGNNTLGIMSPQRGYWINTTEDTTWFVS